MSNKIVNKIILSNKNVSSNEICDKYIYYEIYCKQKI